MPINVQFFQLPYYLARHKLWIPCLFRGILSWYRMVGNTDFMFDCPQSREMYVYESEQLASNPPEEFKNTISLQYFIGRSCYLKVCKKLYFIQRRSEVSKFVEGGYQLENSWRKRNKWNVLKLKTKKKVIRIFYFAHMTKITAPKFRIRKKKVIILLLTFLKTRGLESGLFIDRVQFSPSNFPSADWPKHMRGRHNLVGLWLVLGEGT